MGAAAGVIQDSSTLSNPSDDKPVGILEDVKEIGGLTIEVYKGIAVEAANAANTATIKALARIHETNLASMGETTAPDPSDLLLSFKALALCKLSYMTSIDPNHKDIEQKWLNALEIENYQIWYTTEKAIGPRSDLGVMVNAIEVKALTTLKELTEREYTGALAITGSIPRLCNQRHVSVPFVVFRGTSTTADVLDTLSSLVPETFITIAGNNLGSTGLGFYNHYTMLRDMKRANSNETILSTTLKKLALNPAAGILIAGHGLGAATAALFAGEVYSDYKNVSVNLVTFSIPRHVFDDETKKKLAYKGLQHIRFIDKGDHTIGVASTKANTVTNFHTVITSPSTPAEMFFHQVDKHLDWHVIPTLNDDIGFNMTSMVNAVHKFALTFRGGDDMSGKDDAYAHIFLESNTFRDALFSIQDVLFRESFAALGDIFYTPVIVNPSSSLPASYDAFGVDATGVALDIETPLTQLIQV